MLTPGCGARAVSRMTPIYFIGITATGKIRDEGFKIVGKNRQGYMYKVITHSKKVMGYCNFLLAIALPKPMFKYNPIRRVAQISGIPELSAGNPMYPLHCQQKVGSLRLY